MSLEFFEVKVDQSEDVVQTVSLTSLLGEIRRMNVETGRDEKTILASMERILMVLTGELVIEQETDQPPPEPAEAMPVPPPAPVQPPVEPEVEGEVPVPTKPEHKSKPVQQAKKVQLEDDEFPLRI